MLILTSDFNELSVSILTSMQYTSMQYIEIANKVFY